MGDQRKPLEEVTVVFPPLLWLQNAKDLLGKQRQCLQYQHFQAGGRTDPRDDLQVGVARRLGGRGHGFGVYSLTRLVLPFIPIHSGSWRDRPFKPYNFLAHGVLPDSGHLHPLLKVRTQFRQIFLEMG